MRTHKPYEVIVVGGGPAGIGAAVAAARNGAATLLVERAPFLGGCLTMGYPMNGMFGLDGTQVVNGIPEELFQRVVALGGSAGHAEVHNSWLRTYDLMDAEVVKYVAQEMLLEAGGELLLHALTVDALVEADRIAGVVIAGKGGIEVIPARVVIDCSGDADVAFRAGVPCQKGRESDGQMQAVTLMFRLNHVDHRRLPEYFPQGIAYAVKPGSAEPSFLRGAGNFLRWEKQVLADEVLDRANRAIFANSLRDGEFAANTTRVIGIDATDTWDLTRAEIEGRRQVMTMHAFFKKHLPGFERSAVIATGPFIGVRETRRIIGEYVLTEDDVVEARDFPDNVARGEYPVDIHIPDGSGIYQRFVRDGGSYGIPYRSLVPLKVEQLLVAGRCISATHEAIGSAREMAQCMAMGQAAGTAAALALSQSVTVRAVDVQALRTALRLQGAVLEVADAPLRLGAEPKEVLDPGAQIL
jgi:2-polyprenyl-6-methoxyphenol hydroxylase-like FAD-dependent oxidoreductase